MRSVLRRAVLLVSAVIVIGCGLATHALGSGRVADAVGDVLYAALIYLLLAALLPRRTPLLPAAIAAVWCICVEFLQLTGLPEQWGVAFPPAMLVLGTVFSPVDIACYLAGIAGAALCDATAQQLRRRLPRYSGPRPVKE